MQLHIAQLGRNIDRFCFGVPSFQGYGGASSTSIQGYGVRGLVEEGGRLGLGLLP